MIVMINFNAYNFNQVPNLVKLFWTNLAHMWQKCCLSAPSLIGTPLKWWCKTDKAYYLICQNNVSDV